MSAATIRTADPERDAAACAAIYASSVEASPTSFEEEAPDAAEMARRIRTTSATHPWLVAELDGELVGYAYAVAHRSRPAYRWSVDVSVYVAAGERGRGHGAALYRELFERLREQGFRMAFAGITLPNPASVALHESLGFRQVGTSHHVGWKHGAWRDVGWFQAELSPAPDGDGPPPAPRPPS
jgi:L-amino acid N-acyltransferase YncA